MSDEQPPHSNSTLPDPFLFVGVDSSSIGKRRSNSQSARSHAAKVTHRRKQEAQSSSSAKASEKVAAKLTLETVQQEQNVAQNPDKNAPISLDFSALPSMNFEETPRISGQTTSPLFGGGKEIFHLSALQNVSDPVHYCVNVIWPKYSWYNELAQTWVAKHTQQPLYFHYLHYLTTLHAGLMRNQLDSPSSNRNLLYHRGEIIRSLKETLARQPLAGAELEMAISLVCSLALLDFEHSRGSGYTVLLFVPYLPSAEWLNVLGRLTPVQSHLHAVDILVDQAGGFDNLRSEALKIQIATNDLYQASINNIAPKWPNVWMAMGTDTSSTISCSGAQGFPFIPGSLPSHFLTVLMELNKVDRIMNAFVQGPMAQEEHSEIIRLRNAVHHRLLSLRSWEDLETSEQKGSFSTMYECCRLTAILYSQAIVFPLPPDTRWHIKLLNKLQAVLQTSNLGDQTADVSELLIWVLMIAGIAAYRTSCRPFFEDLLRDVLVKKGWHAGSWADVRQILSDYLWSDEACNRGAAVLWDALGLESRKDRLRPIHELTRRITG